MRRMIVMAALLVGLLSLALIISAGGHGRQLHLSPPGFLASMLE
jgi:hypothetical protein